MFDVVPADIPGMEYMTQSTPFGYQVRHFFVERPLVIKIDEDPLLLE